MVGTFDVENFGDLLFPLLARHELEQRLDEPEVVLYSYHDMREGSWLYDVRSLVRLADEIEALDLLIVGGGDLVRFDVDIAPSYVPPVPDLQHPTGFWLMPTLVAAAAGVSVAWNAVGVIRRPPEREAALLALAAEVVDYLAVRDEPSRERLGPSATSARVVPDTAFGLRALHGSATAVEERNALLREAGVTEPVHHRSTVAAPDAVRTRRSPGWWPQLRGMG